LGGAGKHGVSSFGGRDCDWGGIIVFLVRTTKANSSPNDRWRPQIELSTLTRSVSQEAAGFSLAYASGWCLRDGDEKPERLCYDVYHEQPAVPPSSFLVHPSSFPCLMPTFRIALTGDFLNEAGAPAYGDLGLPLLDECPAVR
jgi:hypothetical protein